MRYALPNLGLLLFMAGSAAATSITSDTECAAMAGPATSSGTSCSSQSVKPDGQPWETYTPATSQASVTTTSVLDLSAIDLQMDLASAAVAGSWSDSSGTIRADASSYA